MTNIKGIIFDWGEVLSVHTFEDLKDYVADQLSVDRNTFREFLDMNKFKPMMDGIIEEQVYWDGIAEEFDTTAPKTKSLWGDAIEACYIPNKKTEKLLRKFSESENYKTALLSNAEYCIVDYYEESDLRHLFEVEVFSCIEKVSKPNPKIYNRALEKLNLNPEETVFIDDREENIIGAENIGIHGIHFKGYDNLVEELGKLGVSV